MKNQRFLTVLVLALGYWLMASAVPARRGQWKTLRLTDGTEVRAQLMGDETLHYWQDANGFTYVCSDEENIYVRATHAMESKLQAKRNARVARRMPSRRAMESPHKYTGKKKGLVILAQYSNKKFAVGSDSLKFTRLLNERGFSEGSFKGSVQDYFYDQSGGKFELDFDVFGPVTLPQAYGYYGKDVGEEGDDVRPGEMIIDACNLVNHMVNFADYDWDGDGWVDQVFVVYAGMGQADGGISATIWPHEWDLWDAVGHTLNLDGVIINTYACGNELDGQEKLGGIGTFCHEFSHCLGLPDMYDTRPNGSNFGMGPWDLMDQGSYGGGGFRPAGYTSYEKMVCGWQEPIVLSESTEVTGMKALSKGGDTYIIYNDACKDEYYLLENRQLTGWDKELYGAGLLVLHVDYDEEAWEQNTVNNVSSHQRCTIFHADNKDGWLSLGDLQGDVYPYQNKRNGQRNDSLTNLSTPKASVFNKNTDGSRLMNKAVLDIKQNADGTISFKFRGTKDDPSAIHTPTLDPWTNPDGKVYGLDGTLLRTKDSDLPKGTLYIENGKKHIKK